MPRITICNRRIETCALAAQLDAPGSAGRDAATDSPDAPAENSAVTVTGAAPLRGGGATATGGFELAASEPSASREPPELEAIRRPPSGSLHLLTLESTDPEDRWREAGSDL